MSDNKSNLTKASFWLALVALAFAAYAVIRSPAPSSSANTGRSSAATQTVMAESTLAKVKRTGVLKAAYVPYPPFVTVDPNTKAASGYFVELMAAIAKEGGFRVEYEEATLATMIAGLNTEKYDTVVSAIFSNIPRAKEVAFTQPVLYVGMSAIARKDETRIQTMEDLAQPGLRFAVLSGGVGRQYVLDNLPNAVRVDVDSTDFTRPMLDVLAGRADITLSESVSCSRFAKEHPEAKNVFANNPYAVFGSCLVVRQNDHEWRYFLDVALDRLVLNGTIARLDAKYKEQLSASAWYSKRTPWEAPANK